MLSSTEEAKDRLMQMPVVAHLAAACSAVLLRAWLRSSMQLATKDIVAAARQLLNELRRVFVNSWLTASAPLRAVLGGRENASLFPKA